MSWNVDGISLLKSSKKSTWSILATVNEIPYTISKNNIILAGLWQDCRKPKMAMFLKPFVNECRYLSEHGMKCTTIFSKKEEIIFKVHLILGSVDTIARPVIQNLKQFNGIYGCPYCLQKGETLEDNRLVRVYCNQEAPEKTLRLLEEHTEIAVNSGKPYKGVKGPTIMSLVPNYNVLKCLPPEYMHA